MRFKCPNCGNAVDSSALRDGDRIVCDHCRKRLKLPPNDHSMELLVPQESETVDYNPDPVPAVKPPQTYVQPQAVPPSYGAYPHAPQLVPQMLPNQPPIMVVPIPISQQPDELIQEQLADMRESRSERKERRSHYNLARSGNPMGMTGFALAMTAFVIALPGFLFVKDLPIFTLLVILVGLPLTIAAIPFGIIGCMKQDRNKLYATIGTITAGLLFIFIYPGLMLMLKHRWS